MHQYEHQSSCIIESLKFCCGNAEAAEQQKQAPRLLPILKRRTRALPSVTLEEEALPGITHTSTEPGEEEQGLAEGIPVRSHGSHALDASGFAYAIDNTGW